MSYSSTLAAQIDNSNRTLNVISTSYSIMQSQQQIIQQLITLNRSSVNNYYSDGVSTPNTNTTTSVLPITISLNELSFSDMSSNTLFQNIMNILENTNDVSNRNLESLDISSSTIETIFGNIENPSTLVCPISLEPFSDDDEIMQIRYCGHYFKSNSLRQWLTRNTHCPICRYNLAENPVS